MRRKGDVEPAGALATGWGVADPAPQCQRPARNVKPDERLQPIEAFVTERYRLRRGDTLYRNHDPFRFLCAVRYGFFKSAGMLPDGREQLTGFQLGGDVLGLDGLATGKHACEVTALEGSEVSVIPYAWDDETANPIALTQIVHRALSREIVRDQGMLLMLGGMLAGQRVAVFLLSLSERLRERGYSRSEFVLRMTRAEMGSFLGMRLATVSRCVTRMVRAGIIEVDNKYVRIVDPDRLRDLASNADDGTRAAAPVTAVDTVGTARRELTASLV